MKDIAIFDLDGTLACDQHRLCHLAGSTPNWTDYNRLCGEDTPFEAVCAVARALQRNGCKIWIVCSRDISTRQQTIAWLEAYHITVDRLLMRPTGNTQCDADLKESFVKDGTIPVENILCVYDDNQDSVNMWRKLPTVCFHVTRSAA